LFAWCAHDDWRSPEYVSACAEELIRRPEAVVCNSATVFVDGGGNPLPDWPDRTFETRGMTRPERAQRLIDHVNWIDVYGLTRRAALLHVFPIEAAWGNDVVLSMRLLMLGDFARVDRPLFHYRAWVAAKPPEKVLSKHVPYPYTDMAKWLFSTAFAAAQDRSEQVDLLRRFVRTFTDSKPNGAPYTCWRTLLEDEHRLGGGTMARPETFGRRLTGWLATSLPVAPELRGREALQLLLDGSRRVLLAASGTAQDLELVEEMIGALKRRLPKSEIALLWPQQRGTPPGVERLGTLIPYDAANDEGQRSSDAALGSVQAWRPDLALCWSRPRSRHADHLVTNAGALLTVCRHQPGGPTRSGWLKREEGYDPNERWSVVLPADADLAALERFLNNGHISLVD
jgi:hypothetical protein